MNLSYNNKRSSSSISSTNTNDEWTVFARAQPSAAGSFQQVTVPTDPWRPGKQVNIKNLSSADLLSLKKKDAFSYYSIPAVRSAALLNKEVDLSKLKESTFKRSCPSRTQTTSEVSPETVLRASRVSFECHIDQLLTEITEVMEELEFEDSEDVLLSLLDKTIASDFD